jgi:hypothetical protein
MEESSDLSMDSDISSSRYRVVSLPQQERQVSKTIRGIALVSILRRVGRGMPVRFGTESRRKESMKVFYAATVLCIIALPVQRAVAQEDHAPMVEQCQADRNLWRYQATEYHIAEAARI